MDTKYQSRIFSGILLVTAIICISFSFLTCFEKRLDLDESNLSYFHNSPEIKEMVLRYAKNLQRYFIYYRNFDIDAAEAKLDEIDKFITTGKIDNAKNKFSTNVKPYLDGSRDKNDESDSNSKINTKPELLYNVDISNMTVDNLLDVQAGLSDAISNYNSVKDYLNNNDDFHFILYSNQLGHILATNTDSFYNEDYYEIIDIKDNIFNTDFNGVILSESFADDGLSCEISIPFTTSTNVKMLMNLLHKQFSNNKVFSSWVVTAVLFGASILLLLFIFIYDRSFLFEINRRIYNVFIKIPMMITVPIMSAIVNKCIYMGVKSANLTGIVIEGHIFKLFSVIFGSIFTVIFTFFFIETIVMLLRRKLKIEELPEIVFITRAINDIKLALGAGKIFFAVCMSLTQILIMGLSCIFLILSINFYMFASYIFSLWIIIFALVIFYNACASEVKLRYYIQEMGSGNMEVVPEQKGMFTNSINQLNLIRENFQNNLDETLRSERLKTDLITNVSHDLKTPLTSIISYVDLLSAMDDNSEQAKEYIEIVKNKSRRLKTLIDDLFEASKLSSGQMKLQCVNSDIVALLEQTLGELSYKIESAGVEFVVTKNQQSIQVYMDGERMWRVFDNLINNILKYSPRGSRAYIDINDEDKNVMITFKNVANYHMEFNADELFERFKRGDTSRTTEGSGLGLSIAKSIVELHGGIMKIITDGDLFKIMVILIKNPTTEDEN